MQTNAKKRKATQQYSQQEINKELDIINGLKQRIESEDCSLHEREVIAARLEQYKNDLPDNEATSALLQMVNKCQLLLVNFVNTELQNIAEETPTLLETSTTNVQFIAWPRAVELHGKISSLGVIVETLPECDAIEQLKEAIYVQRATCEDICGQCINVALKRATSFSDIESILTHINSQDIELLKNFDYYAELDVIIVCLKNAFKDANAIHDNGTTDESPSSDETLKRLKKDCNFVLNCLLDNDFCSPVLTSELDTDPQLLSIIKGTSGQKPVICFFIRLQTYLRMQFKYRSAERFLNFDASALEHRVVSEQVAVLDEFINHPTLVFANDMDNVKLHFKNTLTTGFSYLSENRQEILLGMHQKFLDRVAIYPQLRVFADIFKQTIDEVETSNNESTKTTLNRLAATLHFHYPAPLSPSKFSNGIANREKQEKLRLRLKRLGREKADEGSIESQSRPSKRACNKN